MWLLPAAVHGLMMATVRNQGTPGLILTQQQLKARWATLERNQQCVSPASEPLLTCTQEWDEEESQREQYFRSDT